jgi:hypothetical protein
MPIAMGLAVLGACTSKCGGAGTGSPTRDSRHASTNDEAPRVEAITQAILQSCTAFPSALVSHPGCVFANDAKAHDIAFCTRFAAVSASSLDLFTVLVYRDREHFAETIGAPSMSALFEAGSPVGSNYRKLEGPFFQDVEAGKRQIKTEVRGLGLGGATKWGTLTSANRRFDLTLATELLTHDYPVSQSDRIALESLDFARALTCLDAVLWPKETPKQ